MNSEKRRNIGIAASFITHIILFILLGIFGGYLQKELPTTIMEVALEIGEEGSGSEGSSGGDPAMPEESQPEPEQSVAQPQPVMPTETSDIVPDKPKPVQPTPSKPVKPGKPTSKPGTGSGTGEGSGTGSGTGSGSGTGKGSGSGDGDGDDGGGMVVAPQLIHYVEPNYPPNQRMMEREGRVGVSVLIDTGGYVQDAYVTSSSGFSDFDAAAIDTVYRWRFSPAKNKAGNAMAARVTLTVKFSLR